ncbi:transporter substrate-binding domain-containing protein [Vibrio sp. S4M6]|uniref:substrate-binding periplasmic protein n=1 Tax=Vibrio sinus TaxID=2946865 RepID=UPI00202A3AA8|nr:ABC transporter substrate-binding protein [Vibrio sinus]MCL9780762.1 transporter substrate-binding domain-containing protein [Vibrio sinus]
MKPFYIFFLFLCFPLLAEPLKIYTINEPPLNIVKGKTKEGIAVDVVNEIIKRNNLHAQIEYRPWPRAYQDLLNDKNVVLFSISKTKSRENLFKWVGPIAQKNMVLYARKNAEIDIQSLQEAKQVPSILAMTSDSKSQYLVNNGFKNIVNLPTWKQAVLMLAKKRGTLLTQSDIDFPVLLKEVNLNPSDFEPVFTLFSSQTYIGFSDETPDEIVNQWQRTLQEIKDDGTFNQIVEKWAKYYNAPQWKVKQGMLVSLQPEK